MDFKDLEKYIDTLGEKFIPARELIVYHDHKMIFHYKSGYADANQKKALTGKEMYLICSSTKIATCVGALRLVERGVLNLEDKVSKYLPEYEQLMVKEGEEMRPVKNDLLIRHLFTMCAGFSYDRHSEELKAFKEDYAATTRDIVRAWAKEPLLFEPGTGFYYSFCHDVLGGVIEVVSGKTLENYLKDEIFIPLDMKDTVFHLNEEQKKRLAVHYIYDAEKKCLFIGDHMEEEYLLSPKYESGGAGIYATTSDYAKLADAIACDGMAYNGYQVLKPETVAMYAKNWLDDKQLKDFQEESGHWGQGYGLGCMVLLDKKPRNWKCAEGVFGWGGKAGTKIMMDTKNKLSFYYSQEVVGGPECPYEEHQHNVILNMLYQILGIE